MPIDVERALSTPPAVREIAWTSRDVLLYHLSLGAGANAATDPELNYTYERGLRVLPTFAMVAGQGISSGDRPSAAVHLPGIDVDLRAVLHAGQGLTVHRPLPVSGTARLATRVASVWDKGTAALIVLEQSAVDEADRPLWTSTTQIWARGEGGFGGDPGPRERWTAPDREPDFILDSLTSPGQALLYRLNGDLNPLHIDPTFARAAGFDRPILHGLALYGIVAKAIVDSVLGGDVTRLRGLSVRFAGPLLPGEAIRTRVWQEDVLLFQSTCPQRNDAPVLTFATAEVS